MNVVVKVYRGEVVESTHFGHIAVVDACGKLLYSYGDPHRLTYARSSMKPIQAIPIMETGAADRYGLDQTDLSLCCASHSGEERHRLRVLSILHRAGLPEEILQCGAHPPKDEESYKELLRQGGELTPVYSNCSGKHSGMVVTAAHMGEDTYTYHLPEHPVQLRIMNAIAELTCYPKEEIHIGIDGCGAPVHRLPLSNLAWGFARLAVPDAIANPARREAVRKITAAMVAHPEMVGGNQRYCTDLMRVFKGRIIGKSGAEGVYCLGDRELGLGIAIKIEDGNSRGKFAVMNEILRQLGIGTSSELCDLKSYSDPDITNMKGKIVGQIKAEFVLKSESE